MAKIKTEVYTIDGVDIKVNYNCNSKGVFNTNLNINVLKKIGIQGDLSGGSLYDVETKLLTAIRKYKDSKTSHRLLIAITFGAKGEYTKDNLGEYRQEFMGHNSPYKVDTNWTKVSDLVGMSYKILIEETRDEDTTLYESHTWEECSFVRRENILGRTKGSTFNDYGNVYKLLDYNLGTLMSLENINEQLRKASSFLLDLMESENLQEKLESGNIKQLN